MGWQQISPQRFSRPLGNDEIFMKLAGQIIPDRNNWAVWITARLRVSSSLSHSMIKKLRKAWICLRYHTPLIAAVADGTQYVYEVPDEIALDHWLRNTFFVQSCKTVDDFIAEPRNIPYTTLHYFPHTCEVFLTGPHFMWDGAGMQQAFRLLINFLAEDAPNPEFSDEWMRLIPGLESLSHVESWPTEVAEDTAKRCLGVFGPSPTEDKDSLVSVSLTDNSPPSSEPARHSPSSSSSATNLPKVRDQTPFTLVSFNAVKRGLRTVFSNASNIPTTTENQHPSSPPIAPKSASRNPGSVRRIPMQLSTSTSAAVIAACKTRGYTVTAALHAALISTCDRNPQTVSSNPYYRSNVPANGRRFLPSPYNDLDNIPIGFGLLALPLEILKSDYNDMAQQLTKAYRAPAEHNAGSFLHKYFVTQQMMIVNAATQKPGTAAPAEPLQPGISSLGILDKIIPNQVVASYEVNVEDVDFGFDQMQDMLLLYLSSFRGKIKISANYNDAFWKEDFVWDFMIEVQELWFRELGIDVVKQPLGFELKPCIPAVVVTPPVATHAFKPPIGSEVMSRDSTSARAPLPIQPVLRKLVASKVMRWCSDESAAFSEKHDGSVAVEKYSTKPSIKPPVKPKPKKLSARPCESASRRRLDTLGDDLARPGSFLSESPSTIKQTKLAQDDLALAQKLESLNGNLDALKTFGSLRSEVSNTALPTPGHTELARELDALYAELSLLHGVEPAVERKDVDEESSKQALSEKRAYEKRLLRCTSHEDMAARKRPSISSPPPRFMLNSQSPGEQFCWWPQPDDQTTWRLTPKPRSLKKNSRGLKKKPRRRSWMHAKNKPLEQQLLDILMCGALSYEQANGRSTLKDWFARETDALDTDENSAHEQGDPQREETDYGRSTLEDSSESKGFDGGGNNGATDRASVNNQTDEEPTEGYASSIEFDARRIGTLFPGEKSIPAQSNSISQYHPDFSFDARGIGTISIGEKSTIAHLDSDTHPDLPLDARGIGTLSTGENSISAHLDSDSYPDVPFDARRIGTFSAGEESPLIQLDSNSHPDSPFDTRGFGTLSIGDGSPRDPSPSHAEIADSMTASFSTAPFSPSASSVFGTPKTSNTPRTPSSPLTPEKLSLPESIGMAVYGALKAYRSDTLASPKPGPGHVHVESPGHSVPIR